MLGVKSEIRIRQTEKNKWEVCEFDYSLKGVHIFYCKRILLRDCETIEEAQGAQAYFEQA